MITDWYSPPVNVLAVRHYLLVRRADCRLTRCDTAVYLRLHLNYVALQLHFGAFSGGSMLLRVRTLQGS